MTFPDITTRQGVIYRYAIVLAMAFLAIEIGDQLSGLIVPFTIYVYGLSGLIGFGVTGIACGWVLQKLFQKKALSSVFTLPAFMLVAGLVGSVIRFIDQERIFDLFNWLAYIFTSKTGLYWLVFFPLGAYAAIKFIFGAASKNAA